MTANPSVNPSRNPSPNPSEKGHFERRRTPAPAPTPSPSTSSRSDAQTRGRANQETLTSRIRSTPQAVALARLVLDLRPEWSPADVYAWALNDDRPWRDVIAAGINGARDRDIREPGGLRYAGPAAPSPAPTPPPPHLALIDPERDLCHHGSRHGACPQCRRSTA